MFDNDTNQTQDQINFDPQRTFNAADSVVKEPQKPWSLPTSERALLTIVGFFTCFFAFRSEKALVEWQFGLTIALAVVFAIVVPALFRKNKRVTSELNDQNFCPCFTCSIEYIFFSGAGLILVLVVNIVGRTTYGLIAGLGGILMFLAPVLYLENERVTSRFSEEITEPRTFRHASIFLGLAIIVGSGGWFSGTAMRTFIEIAVPKLTLL
ncbi:hypothetical protein J5I95_04970 [Candidatus Poribacteria bacterium]|nr:hypothetical protein [Candidatus Poribacteria bacterium]